MAALCYSLDNDAIPLLQVGKNYSIHSFRLPYTLHQNYMHVAMYTHYLPQKK